MKTPWIWVDLAAIVALLFFVVLLIDNIVQHGKGWAKRFWKSHIVDDFPEHYADCCFTCWAQSCEGWEFEKRGGNYDI